MTTTFNKHGPNNRQPTHNQHQQPPNSNNYNINFWWLLNPWWILHENKGQVIVIWSGHLKVPKNHQESSRGIKIKFKSFINSSNQSFTCQWFRNKRPAQPERHTKLDILAKAAEAAASVPLPEEWMRATCLESSSSFFLYLLAPVVTHMWSRGSHFPVFRQNTSRFSKSGPWMSLIQAALHSLEVILSCSWISVVWYCR